MPPWVHEVVGEGGKGLWGGEATPGQDHEQGFWNGYKRGEKMPETETTLKISEMGT